MTSAIELLTFMFLCHEWLGKTINVIFYMIASIISFVLFVLIAQLLYLKVDLLLVVLL